MMTILAIIYLWLFAFCFWVLGFVMGVRADRKATIKLMDETPLFKKP